MVPQSSGDTGTASASAEPTVPSQEPVKTISVETINSSETSEVETEKHPIESKEIQVVDKPVIEEKPVPASHDKLVTGSSPRVIDVQVDDDDDDDDVDDWLKEEDNAGHVSSSTVATKHVVDEDEDVTFSDLEDDDDDVPVSYKK
ncbi:unnamed protein product [Eruca vesicaria subsp. sativa]|uniref:Uncharacterized protein n=1 Tax=Eruca vesicaria subsp. sativa TaxID=29727 RepID=A0ABC8L687_ERUVS|nr:unnamed protein product [Eruca vesicaria subsp. sativa]